MHVLGTAAAAAASHQSCPTLYDPIDGSLQGSPSLGFSRQEHWSGLPFPSPMHESEKWKWSHWVMSNSQRPHGLQPTRLHCPSDFPGKNTGVGCHAGNSAQLQRWRFSLAHVSQNLNDRAELGCYRSQRWCISMRWGDLLPSPWLAPS